MSVSTRRRPAFPAPANRPAGTPSHRPPPHRGRRRVPLRPELIDARAAALDELSAPLRFWIRTVGPKPHKHILHLQLLPILEERGWTTAVEVALLLGAGARNLSKCRLAPLVDAGRLERRYPERARHPARVNREKSASVLDPCSPSATVVRQDAADANDRRTFRAAMLDTGMWDRVRAECDRSGEPLFILGETFGKKVQDLDYGQQGRAFRVFDMYLGPPRRGRFLDYDELLERAGAWGLETTPRLYRGPFSMETAEQHRDGRTTFRGNHVREGIVIAPVRERECPDLLARRVKPKFVSPKYPLRRCRSTDFT